MKIFHGLVNYGTQAGLFAKGLREAGHKAVSATRQDSFKRLTDIEITNTNQGSKLKRILFHIIYLPRKLYWFFKFDIYHFYFGTTMIPGQLDLPFYRFFGKKVVFHYLGSDVDITKQRLEKKSEKFLKRKKLRIKKRLRRENKYAQLQLVCSPIYSQFVRNSGVLPLAVDLDNYKYTPPKKSNDSIKILHAPTHRAFKGTAYIEAAIDKLLAEKMPISFKIVENVTHKQLKKEYERCDIFIDQIMAGWYGTASIEAMAIGRPVVSSINKNYFRFIDYGNKIPIIHGDPDCIYNSIKYLIVNQDKLLKIGKASRAFVEEVHDYKKLTSKLVNMYKNI